ncbi:MAG TPA: DUF2207 domain-containing protein [Candidatus Acidoferrales bacterium]|nr:DUF2207 domain-containing protein [Candidatus Acidoferrales bacterium]
MKTQRRRTLALLAIIAIACLAAPPAFARQLTIQKFDSLVVVNTDGTIDVSETIIVQFTGQWHGIYRTIPVNYTTAQGFNYSLLLDHIVATDDAGTPLKVEVSRIDNYRQLKIYVSDATDATRTIMLHYRVEDGLRFFADHDELYWNATGDRWDAPLPRATAEIQVPVGTTGIHALAFTGAYGATSQDSSVRVAQNDVTIETRNPLGFHQGLTIVVGWDKGFVHEPTFADKATLFLRSNWILAVPILAFIVMFWLWWNFGRDPRLQPIAVQYEPPDNLTPGEAGTLVDNEASMRDITATLVDLAVKGYIVIEQTERDQMLGLLHSKDYTFHMKKPATSWGDARPHEQSMLNGLFGGGSNSSVKLSELRNHFYVNLPEIRDRIFEGLIGDGYYLHRPDIVRNGFIVGAVFIGVAVGFFSISLLSQVTIVSAVVSAIATAAIIAGFGWFMPARTVTGARAFEKVLGFEDFLRHVESDPIKRIEKTPEMFEKFLPYAMALHVESNWVKSFAGVAMQPPQWYQGSYAGGFYPYLLVNDLNFMSGMAASSFASAPRSAGGRGFAGGSGFGGGGFAGGGFGGGGGGGF